MSKKQKKPRRVVICGNRYKILYVKKPSDVDIFKRESLWGQIDYWTRTIRIYDDGKVPISGIWETIFHEIIHGLTYHLKLKSLKSNDEEDYISALATGLADTLVRNGWLKL